MSPIPGSFSLLRLLSLRSGQADPAAIDAATHRGKSALAQRRSLRSVPAILGTCLLAGCATMPGESAMPRLTGTSWQLVAIHSMDDAQGTTRIADPSRFTLRFGDDGRAVLRLDCNRGSGSYEARPATDGRSGSLSFGPIAATRALCPPPNLDERVARDLGYVRSYLLKDGKLYLTLMADGGIHEWQPATRATEDSR